MFYNELSIGYHCTECRFLRMESKVRKVRKTESREDGKQKQGLDIQTSGLSDS